jgi:hypothetical protein
MNLFPSSPRIDIAPPINKMVANLSSKGAEAVEKRAIAAPSRKPVVDLRTFVLSLNPQA